MPEETSIAFAWIISTLSGDAELAGYAPGGVTRRYAQVATVPPYVVMTYQDGVDYPVFGGGNACTDALIEVVVEGPATAMQAIVNAAKRVKTLLTVTVPVAVSGGSIQASFRLHPVETDPLLDGEQWTSLGGVFKVTAVEG
jgi:hypothetical protein